MFPNKLSAPSFRIGRFCLVYVQIKMCKRSGRTKSNESVPRSVFGDNNFQVLPNDCAWLIPGISLSAIRLVRF
jgi:hypothetical protein